MHLRALQSFVVLVILSLVGVAQAYSPPPAGIQGLLSTRCSVTLQAEPPIIDKGQTTKLIWTTQKAASASIDNGVGTVSPVSGGSIEVKPSQTTTYKITAYCLFGGSASATAIVVVGPEPRVVIDLVPTFIYEGQTAQIQWQAFNVREASIDQGIGKVFAGNPTNYGNGTLSVRPIETTTYTISGVGLQGSLVSAQATLIVATVPRVTLKADPSSINYGDASDLVWTTKYADTAEIDNGVGSVSPVSAGQLSVSPTKTTLYTITAKKTYRQPNGAEITLIAKASAYVFVNWPGPLVTLEADPARIRQNDLSKLKWTIRYATEAVIDNGVGIVYQNGDGRPVTGEASVRPLSTTTYRITARDGEGRTVSAEATIEVSNSELSIILPPKLIMTPDQLYFGGNTYRFNPAKPEFVLTSGDAANYRVEVRELNFGWDNDTRGNYYSLTINSIFPQHGIARTKQMLDRVAWLIEKSIHPAEAADPYGLKLTFKQPVTEAAIDSLSDSLLAGGNRFNARLADGRCQAGEQSAYICLTSTTRFNDQSLSRELAVNLVQVIPLDALIIEGNVAGTTLDRFRIGDHAIAVGGQVKDVRASTKLNDYLTGSNLTWDKLSPQIDALYARRGQATAIAANDIGLQGNNGSFPADRPCVPTCTWNLNAVGNDPGGSGSSTFSTPPEGKLWNIDPTKDGNADFVLGRVGQNDMINFTGSGTIVLPGKLTVNGKIKCTQGTRLAILAKGGIEFNTNDVECGAYTAMGGSITLANNGYQPTDGLVKAILVARDDVILPSPDRLEAPYQIKYDQQYALNPTVLFKELLKLIISSNS